MMPSLPPQTASAANSRFPSDTALKTAVRSAQTVGVKEAFSMLQPWYTVPSAQSSAAPTLKSE